MASRQEQKEQRRREREELEARERASAARRRRLQLTLGGVLGALVLAGVVVLVLSLASGNDSSSSASGQKAASSAKLPPVKIADLPAAAKAAGCKVVNPPIEGRGHDSKDFKAADYNSNPPTSGPHNPVWYQDGIYEPGDTPKLGMLVHTLEHGRIDVQYRPGTPKKQVSQLEAFVQEQDGGYHQLLFQNATKMPYAVAATAWGHLVGCPSMNDRVFDALRAFRTAYVDQGPEKVP